MTGPIILIAGLFLFALSGADRRVAIAGLVAALIGLVIGVMSAALNF
jgi:hypothetical protein